MTEQRTSDPPCPRCGPYQPCIDHPACHDAQEQRSSDPVHFHLAGNSNEKHPGRRAKCPKCTPEQRPSNPQRDAKDAARYRWLREHSNLKVYSGLSGAGLDIAVDVDMGVAADVASPGTADGDTDAPAK